MAYYITKPHILDSTKTLFYVGSNRWTETYNDRKVFPIKSIADNRIINTDGRNGGFEGSQVLSD